MNFEARLTELNFQEILYYLGYRSQGIDDTMQRQMDGCIQKIVKASKPKLVYKVCPVQEGNISIPLQGNDAQGLLAQADEVILFCATIGMDVERLLIRTEVMNMSDALIMDSCASVAIENVCNNLEKDIRKEYESKGLFVSDRFSPGYGDLPLEFQKYFCSFLNTEKTIGVNVSNSYIMTPRKSVTAFLAISKKPYTLRKSGCEVCRMFMSCEFRKAGKYCGK